MAAVNVRGPLDPHVNTREDYTEQFLSIPIPDNASEEWRNYVSNLQNLYRKLAYHSGMRPNLRQTYSYMTPANVKTKIYFMWDFIGRTLGMAYSVPPMGTFATLRGQAKETWEDVVSRTELAKMLLLDTRPGMLDMMVESTYPENSGELPFGQRPVIGEDILAIAREL